MTRPWTPPPRRIGGARSRGGAGVVRGDHRSQQYSQQQSRSKSIIDREEGQQQQRQLDQPPVSSPAIIHRDHPNAFVSDYDCSNENDVPAAADIHRVDSKGSSDGAATMTAATIHQQDETNDQEPHIVGMGGEEEMITFTETEKVNDDEIGEEQRDESKDGEEEEDDVIDLGDDITTEGRDDHDEVNNASATEESIEVQPNQKRSVLALVSEGVIDRVQASNQRRALFLLDARKVPYEKVDGMDPAQREVRDGLFDLAGFGGSDDGNGDGDTPAKKRKPVSYPQFFFVGDGAVSYVGDFERLLSLNDASDIPREILDQHPELETWERVFVNLVDPSEIASLRRLERYGV